MANSDQPSSYKCLSGILRRLVCSRSIPTHPSDDFPSDHRISNVKYIEERQDRRQDSKPSYTQAGVVARLMGLESLPTTTTTTTTKTFGSFLRSRSVNSIDELSSAIDFTNKLHHHRRVKTLTSFIEDPKKEKEKEEATRNIKRHVSVKSHRDKVSKGRDTMYADLAPTRTGRKVDKGDGGKFTGNKDSNRVTRVKNRRPNERSTMKIHKRVDSREALGKNKCVMANNNRKHTDNIVISKHSCPNNKQRQVTKPGNSSKTTCREKCEISHGEEPKAMAKMLAEICRLSKDDVQRTPWITHQDHHHRHRLLFLSDEDVLEDISVCLGQQIFHVLLDQVVDELLVINMMK